MEEGAGQGKEGLDAAGKEGVAEEGQTRAGWEVAQIGEGIGIGQGERLHRGGSQ